MLIMKNLDLTQISGEWCNALQYEVASCILPYWMYVVANSENSGYWGQVDNNNKVSAEADVTSILLSRLQWSFSEAYGVLGYRGFSAHASRCRSFSLNNFASSAEKLRWSLHQENASEEDDVICNAYWLMAESVYCAHIKESTDNVHAMFQSTWNKFANQQLAPPPYRVRHHLLEACLYYFKYNAASEEQKSLLRVILAEMLCQFETDTFNAGHTASFGWLLIDAMNLVDCSPELVKRAVSIHCVKMEPLLDSNDLSRDGIPASAAETNRIGWMQAEAMLACWKLYRATNNPFYWQAAYSLWRFIQLNVSDHVSGEWLPEGNLVSTNSYIKADVWKCPYHSTRACLEIYKDLVALNTQ